MSSLPGFPLRLKDDFYGKRNLGGKWIRLESRRAEGYCLVLLVRREGGAGWGERVVCRGYFFLHASYPGLCYRPGGIHTSLSPTQQILPNKCVLLISFSPATALSQFSAIPHICWVRLGKKVMVWELTAPWQEKRRGQSGG